MQVRARTIDWDEVPADIEPFVARDQTFITAGRDYGACALSVYRKVTFVLVIDDLERPEFLPGWLFTVVASDVPPDWICSLMLGDGVDLVLGPEFVARDLKSYNSMIDQESDQIDRLWNWHRDSGL